MVAFFYLADSGLMYRKYRQGKIDKSKFYRSLRAGSIAAVSGAVIGVAGTTLGFSLGTIVLPGPGSAIGAVTGGLLGGYFGSKFIT